MYKKSFYIKQDVGNNKFSYEQRLNKKLFVPELIDISSYEQIELGKEIVFEDFDFDGNLQSCTGLKNFYKIKWKGKEIILVDNHNHVFYFWYEARKNNIIQDGSLLLHMDEHSDMRNNNKYLNDIDTSDMNQVFEFTNFNLNVGDYIIPAQKQGLIGNIVQIRNETNLEDYLENKKKLMSKSDNGIIFNLDLDFFREELDYISFDLKKKVVLDIAEKASVITVASSPFFICQERAVGIFKKLFG